MKRIQTSKRDERERLEELFDIELFDLLFDAFERMEQDLPALRQGMALEIMVSGVRGIRIV